MLDHAQVVVRRAAAKNEVARTRPEIRDIDGRVQLLRHIRTADPPSRTVRRRKRDCTPFASAERTHSGHARFTGKRHALCAPSGRIRKAHVIDRLGVKPASGRRKSGSVTGSKSAIWIFETVSHDIIFSSFSFPAAGSRCISPSPWTSRYRCRTPVPRTGGSEDTVRNIQRWEPEDAAYRQP